VARHGVGIYLAKVYDAVAGSPQLVELPGTAL
jgi:hypothetical protein